METFTAALSDACRAGKALQDCHAQRQTQNRHHIQPERARQTQLRRHDIQQEQQASCSLETDDDYCSEEREDYKEKWEELQKYRAHVQMAYEDVLKDMNTRLEEMEKQRLATQRHHREMVEKMEEKHDTDMKETKRASMQADILKLKSEAMSAAKLKELQQSYDKQHQEVETLRSRLAEKEKALHQLKDQIEAQEKEVKLQRMTADRDQVAEQLRMWAEIESMVSRLPEYEKVEQLVRGIFKEVEKIKGKAVHKRAVSWRE